MLQAKVTVECTLTLAELAFVKRGRGVHALIQCVIVMPVGPASQSIYSWSIRLLDKVEGLSPNDSTTSF